MAAGWGPQLKRRSLGVSHLITAGGPLAPEMQAAIIGALIGGAGGYLAGHVQEWQTRRRRNRAIASVLLVELRGAENLLHRFAEDIDNPTGDFQVDNFDRLDPVVLEMGSDAPHLALEFKYRVDEIRTLRKRQATELTPARRDTLKVKLVFAARCVHLLKEALLQAGGSAPPPEDYQEVRARDVDMPPKAFDYGPPGPRPLVDRNRGQG